MQLACLYSRSGIRSAPIASVQASEVCGGCGWCGRAMFSCAFGFSSGICGLCLGLCYFFCRVALRRWRVLAARCCLLCAAAKWGCQCIHSSTQSHIMHCDVCTVGLALACRALGV